MPKRYLFLSLAVVIILFLVYVFGPSGLPRVYTLDMALKNRDYVSLHGTVYHADVFDAFFHSVQNGADAGVRIVDFTVEGDPIITSVAYQNGLLTVTRDTTRDRFGRPSVIRTDYQNLLFYRAADGWEYYIATDLPEITAELFQSDNIGDILISRNASM